MKKRDKETKVLLLFVLAIVILLVVGTVMGIMHEKKLQEPSESESQVVLSGIERKRERKGTVLTREEASRVIAQKAEETARGEVGGQWHEAKVRITDTYEQTYVVLQYVNVMNGPAEAVIYNPDFTEYYSAIYKNENLDGEIIFELSAPEKGVWTILLLEEGNLGTYRIYSIEKQQYEELKTKDEEREIPY